MQAPIKTIMHNGKENKECNMPTNSYFCLSHNTFYIQTGKRLNITVVDFDNKEKYKDLIK